MKTTLLAGTVLWAAVLIGSALGTENRKGLSPVKTTKLRDFTFIKQSGPEAEDVNKILQRIKVPTGFRIRLYAIVPGARHMAVGAKDIVTFVGTMSTNVWTVIDRDRDRTADEVRNFAPSISKWRPNGPCFSPDGSLYISEKNRVLTFPAAESSYETPDAPAFNVLEQGELVPTKEEGSDHNARVCRIGPDGKLYIALGQPYNVPPPDKLEIYDHVGMGGIIRLATDGSNREVFTRGIRNSVGLDFNPRNGELWFTDNQVDGMGDDIPPGELNRQTSAGQNFGFPWYGGGHTRTDEYKDDDPPADVEFPVVEMVAHAAHLGMIFYTGTQFPEKYRSGIFSAQHRSWDRSTPIGARVMFTPINADGTAGATEVFAEGWIEDGSYLGRPVDVAQLRDGSILVSDDRAGAIYRISYGD